MTEIKKATSERMVRGERYKTGTEPLQSINLPIDTIIWRQDLYPRMEFDPDTVQKYADNISVLPPIEVNQHHELIDGFHRLTAHKTVKVETIPVFITETISDAHLLELAIKRNAKHGLQLSEKDKRDLAVRLYLITPEQQRKGKKDFLANLLSIDVRSLRNWLSRTDKETKEKRNKRIFAAWMACYTQQEIAEKEGISQQTVAQILPKTEDFPKLVKPSVNHKNDEKPDIPIYNVWKFKEKSGGSTHPGNTDPAILDRLLYLYTDPFDIVVDPFAGGGSTIDVCKKRFRRYWVSDRVIVPKREGQIREWDITEGLPPVPRWKDVKLVYLDPPYWKQMENQYSQDPNDLANMNLDKFNSTLLGLINKFAKKLQPGSQIALIIQPTQWNAPNREYTDHVADMIRLVKRPIIMRIQCPYESQQATAQMVTWAKENRQLLVLSRELIVWEIPSKD